MRRITLLIGLLAVAIGVYFVFFNKKSAVKHEKTPAPPPLSVSKHSDAFNKSFENVLNAYYGLTESFVNWDDAKAAGNAASLKTAADSFLVDELKKDSIIYASALEPLNNFKVNIAQVVAATDWNGRRVAFLSLSEHLRQLTIVTRYDRQKIYWQECPMAFNDTEPGYWLSSSDEIRNPYLGTKHPKYHSGMLACGAVQDSIDFTK